MVPCCGFRCLRRFVQRQPNGGFLSELGVRVMERIIQGQLNGELKFEWREEGVVSEITIDT